MNNLTGTDFCRVRVAGFILNEPTLEVEDERYRLYSFDIEAARFSGKSDIINVVIKEESVEFVKVDDEVVIEGTLRTYKCGDNGSRTKLLAYEISRFKGTGNDVNTVDIEGTIISTRCTNNKKGAAVCEARIEVVGNYGKMSRITVVSWGSSAEAVEHAGIGKRLWATGRLQTRKYKNDLPDNRSTVEVAARSIEIA